MGIAKRLLQLLCFFVLGLFPAEQLSGDRIQLHRTFIGELCAVAEVNTAKKAAAPKPITTHCTIKFQYFN